MKGDEHPWLWKQVTFVSTWLQVLAALPGSCRPRVRLQDLFQLQIPAVLGTGPTNWDHCRAGRALGREQEPPPGRAGCPGCVLGSEGTLHCLLLSSAQLSSLLMMDLSEPLLISRFTGTDPEGWEAKFSQQVGICIAGMWGKSRFSPP